MCYLFFNLSFQKFYAYTFFNHYLIRLFFVFKIQILEKKKKHFYTKHQLKFKMDHFPMT